MLHIFGQVAADLGGEGFLKRGAPQPLDFFWALNVGHVVFGMAGRTAFGDQLGRELGAENRHGRHVGPGQGRICLPGLDKIRQWNFLNFGVDTAGLGRGGRLVRLGRGGIAIGHAVLAACLASILGARLAGQQAYKQKTCYQSHIGPPFHTCGHGLAHALAVLAFFHPPVPNILDDFLDLVVGLLDDDEGHEQRRHLRAIQDRGLGAEENGSSGLFTNLHGRRHGIDTVHAPGAVAVINGELGAVVAHATGGAAIHDFLDDVELAPVATGMGTAASLEFAGNIGFHAILIDADVVLPGTDDREVGTGDGGHAAVRAAVELELELVGEGWAVQLVLIVVGQGVAEILRIVAGEFATRLAKAVSRGTQVAARAAEVGVELVGNVVENFFQLGRGGPEQDDVTRGAVHVGQTGTAQIPDVHDATQVLRGVVLAGGLGQTHRVEVGHAGELFGLVAVTADDAAAVPKDADDAAVLPVSLLVLVGELQHAEQIAWAINGDLIIQAIRIGGPVSGFLFDVGHEAGPRPAFELVQQGGLVFRHLLPPVVFEELPP